MKNKQLFFYAIVLFVVVGIFCAAEKASADNCYGGYCVSTTMVCGVHSGTVVNNTLDIDGVTCGSTYESGTYTNIASGLYSNTVWCSSQGVTISDTASCIVDPGPMYAFITGPNSFTDSASFKFSTGYQDQKLDSGAPMNYEYAGSPIIVGVANVTQGSNEITISTDSNCPDVSNCAFRGPRCCSNGHCLSPRCRIAGNTKYCYNFLTREDVEIGRCSFDCGTYTLTAFAKGPSSSASASKQVTFECPSPPPLPSPPTVDIKANGSDGPITIAYNTAATLSWNSSDAESCTSSWGGSKSTSGSESTGNLTSNKTYTITCESAGGSADDSVTVNVGTLPEESVCGSAHGQTYTPADWPTSGFCTNGGTSTPARPALPSLPDGTTSWDCPDEDDCWAKRSGGGVNPVNGACGTRNTTYLSFFTAWPSGSTYCSAGSNSSSPAFPSAGSLVSWNCNGSNGGTNATCSATRNSTYQCTGIAPNGTNQIMCANDNVGLTSNLEWLSVGSCTTRKCEYYTSTSTKPTCNQICNPSIGCAEYDCLNISGANRCRNSSCRLKIDCNCDPPPPLSLCGSENGKTYRKDDSDWSTENFCTDGNTAIGGRPLFPGLNETTYWNCHDENGCWARRTCIPYCDPALCKGKTHDDGCRGTCYGTRDCDWKEVEP